MAARVADVVHGVSAVERNGRRRWGGIVVAGQACKDYGSTAILLESRMVAGRTTMQSWLLNSVLLMLCIGPTAIASQAGSDVHRGAGTAPSRTAIVVALSHDWQPRIRGKTSLVELYLSNRVEKNGGLPLSTVELGVPLGSKIDRQDAVSLAIEAKADRLLYVSLYLHPLRNNSIGVECILPSSGSVVWVANGQQFLADNASDMVKLLLQNINSEIDLRSGGPCLGG